MWDWCSTVAQRHVPFQVVQFSPVSSSPSTPRTHFHQRAAFSGRANWRSQRTVKKKKRCSLGNRGAVGLKYWKASAQPVLPPVSRAQIHFHSPQETKQLTLTNKSEEKWITGMVLIVSDSRFNIRMWRYVISLIINTCFWESCCLHLQGDILQNNRWRKSNWGGKKWSNSKEMSSRQDGRRTSVSRQPVHITPKCGAASSPITWIGDIIFHVPHYKPEGRGFDSRWCDWNFSLI